MSSGFTAVPARPVVPSFAVDRPALVDRLDDALARRVVFLVAPAGYGKSVLLAQWAAARPGRTVAWVSARGVGRDALLFARRLHAGLADADADLGGRLDRLPGTLDRLGSVFLDHLVDELDRSEELVLVIEDFEELSSPDVLAEVGQLAERLPAHVRLILASRRDPNIGPHRLRLQDEIDEIRQGELTMTEAEARDVVGALSGCQLRDDQARALVDRTEGWAAGLQLAALSLRHQEDIETYLEEFAGDDRHVADYLSDEILEGLDEVEREFLVVTSVLDRLSGPLCDALTRRDDGQRMLESLHGRSLFLVALDSRAGWYRYHALFRDLLHYELRKARPGEEADLHRRAAGWLLDADLPAAAAEHLVAAGAWEEVIDLAQREGRAFFERGEAHIVLGWMDRLPRELVESRPDLAQAVVMLRLMVGQALAAEDLAERTDLAHDLPPRLAAVVDVAHFTLVYHHGSPATVLRAAHRTLDRLPEATASGGAGLFGLLDARSLRIQAQAAIARAHLLLGEVGEARRWIDAAVDDNPYAPWLVHAIGTAAYCEALSGRLGVAADQARRALVVAEEAHLIRHPACADAHLALARVHTQRGELDAAEVELNHGLAAARSNRRHLLVGLHRAEWADWMMASARPDSLVLVTAEHGSGEPPSPPGVAARLAAVQARLYLAAGRGERAGTLLDGHDGLWTTDLAAARAAVCAATRDVAGLRKTVAAWPAADADEPWSRLQRAVWQVVLLDLDGERSSADAALADLLGAAEPDGHVQLFRDGGRELARILRRRYLTRPTPYLRKLVEAVADAPATAHSDDLVEQLSERELEVLRYLPSRLSNAEIAAKLYVSVNTLKTHLKAIYRKLGVTSRSAAVARAEELDLA